MIKCLKLTHVYSTMYFSFMSQSSLVSDISMIASKNFLFAAGPAILDLQILNKLVGYIFRRLRTEAAASLP